MRLVVLLALATALAACGGETETATAPPAQASTEASESAVAGTTLDGAPISLDDSRGKPVFVNVWSSW